MSRYVTEKSNDYSLLDNRTGEIIDFVQTRKVTLDEFIMVFFSSYPQLMKLKGNQLKVLICCWKYSSYNPDNEDRGNVVYNGPSFKEACRDNGLEVSNAVIDNAISALCKQGFLIKKYRGEYLLNPQYFFKGRLSNRSKMKISFEVTPEENNEDSIS